MTVPLARAYGAEVVALHVIPTNLPASGGFRSLPNLALLRPYLRDDVSRALDGALQHRANRARRARKKCGYARAGQQFVRRRTADNRATA